MDTMIKEDAEKKEVLLELEKKIEHDRIVLPKIPYDSPNPFTLSGLSITYKRKTTYTPRFLEEVTYEWKEGNTSVHLTQKGEGKVYIQLNGYLVSDFNYDRVLLGFRPLLSSLQEFVNKLIVEQELAEIRGEETKLRLENALINSLFPALDSFDGGELTPYLVSNNPRIRTAAEEIYRKIEKDGSKIGKI